MTSIALPSSLTSIGYEAFAWCDGLTSPSSVTSIGEGAFYYCYNLASVILSSGLTSIGSTAFSECSSLTSINIPSSVTSIGWYAFSRCSSLASVDIPSSVTFIGGGAFEYCSSLTSVTLPSGITSIGSSTFRWCEGLTNINIPSSVTSIGDRAFEYCGLESVYVSWGTPLKIYTSKFDGVDTKTCILYVPKGTLDAYKNSVWGEIFENIVEYDATGINHVTTSGDAKETSRYTADGQRLDAPAKGLNIVKYSDGSVKKVIIQ